MCWQGAWFVFGVLFNDRVLKIDDPCGAISVHGYCGWLGAVSVGIFADGAYGQDGTASVRLPTWATQVKA